MQGPRVIPFDGEWDLARRTEFTSSIMDALGDLREQGELVLDMRAVSYADSTVIAALHACSRAAREHGVVFAVAASDGPLRRLFTLVALDAVIPIGATPEAAIALARTRAV